MKAAKLNRELLEQYILAGYPARLPLLSFEIEEVFDYDVKQNGAMGT